MDRSSVSVFCLLAHMNVMEKSVKFKFVTLTVLCVFCFGFYLSNVMTDKHIAVISGTELSIENRINDKTAEHSQTSTDLTSNALQAPLPVSLEGVDTSIQLTINEQGFLIVTAALKDTFDLYLSALGEESLQQIRQRVFANLKQQLQQPALGQAEELFDRYIDYKQDLASIQDYLNEQDMASGQLDGYRQRSEKVKALRYQYFSEEEHQAFFTQEEEYDEYMFQQLSIAQNTQLTPAEKQQQMEDLEHTLPQAVQETRRSATVHGDLHHHVSALKQAGASEEEIYQARVTALGDDAAQSLAELDQKRNLWNSRVSDYKRQKEQVLSSGLSQAEKTESLNAWLQDNFTELEQLRVKAITAN